MHGTMEMLNLGFHCVLAILCQRLICGIACQGIHSTSFSTARKWTYSIATGLAAGGALVCTLIIPVCLILQVLSANRILGLQSRELFSFMQVVVVGNIIAIALYILMGIGDLTFSWFCM